MKYKAIDKLIPNPDKVQGLMIRKCMEDIQTLETLPPQIDYAYPYYIKADAANKWLQANLTPKHYLKVMMRIERRTDHYYGPEGAGQYDSLF